MHVPGDTVRADYEASRGRFSLVSDCVGDSLGGRPVEASGGEVKGGHGRLAGSSSGSGVFERAFPEPGLRTITALAGGGASAQLRVRVLR